MPAAAVIPAPLAYVKVAAVKTLVVGKFGKAVENEKRKFFLFSTWSFHKMG